MYSKEQKEKALKLYDKYHSVTKVIRELGYPESRQGLYLWIRQRNNPPKEKAPRKRINNSPEHPRHPSVNTKLEILNRCFTNGENVQLVSEDTGYSRASIYTWRRKYLTEGPTALMNEHDDPRGDLKEGSPSSSGEIELLKQQIQDMKLEIDILKETINVLKKDPGVNMSPLKNREKAVIVDALKEHYPLPLLLSRLALSKSSYYYQEKAFRKPDKHKDLRNRITEIFTENKGRYGYRRIYGMLKREDLVISEKIIRRIMREEGLYVILKKRRTYNSYKGEISPAAENLINRDFHAEKPNEKWLTDISEFAIPAGKVYLSPIVDCFDGALPAWTIGTAPNAVLVNSMLDKAISLLSDGTDVISWGDNLKEVIDAGLNNCTLAVIVISPSYFGREWTEYEIQTLLRRQDAEKNKLILPILYHVSKEEFIMHYPMLKDIVFKHSKSVSKNQLALEVKKELDKKME